MAVERARGVKKVQRVVDEQLAWRGAAARGDGGARGEARGRRRQIGRGGVRKVSMKGRR